MSGSAVASANSAFSFATFFMILLRNLLAERLDVHRQWNGQIRAMVQHLDARFAGAIGAERKHLAGRGEDIVR